MRQALGDLVSTFQTWGLLRTALSLSFLPVSTILAIATFGAFGPATAQFYLFPSLLAVSNVCVACAAAWLARSLQNIYLTRLALMCSSLLAVIVIGLVTVRVPHLTGDEETMSVAVVAYTHIVVSNLWFLLFLPLDYDKLWSATEKGRGALDKAYGQYQSLLGPSIAIFVAVWLSTWFQITLKKEPLVMLLTMFSGPAGLSLCCVIAFGYLNVSLLILSHLSRIRSLLSESPGDPTS